MPVYLIQSGGHDGPVKIGHGQHPYRRLVNLQLGSPEELVLIGVLPGGQKEERELHSRFADRRIRGEWFRYHPDMCGGSVLPPPIGREPSRARQQSRLGLARWLIDSNIHDRALSSAVGIHHSTVSRVVSGKRNASVRLVEDLVKYSQQLYKERKAPRCLEPNDFFDLPRRSNQLGEASIGCGSAAAS